MACGGKDVGKSTFLRYLVNVLLIRLNAFLWKLIDFIGFVENVEDCEMKELDPDYVQAVAERVPTKVTPLEGAKKKFILEKLNLDNVPVELRDKYRKVILRHHEAISQHKFELG